MFRNLRLSTIGARFLRFWLHLWNHNNNLLHIMVEFAFISLQLKKSTGTMRRWVVALGASRFDFTAFALGVARAPANEHGVFNRIFLFNPYGAQKAVQVYPQPAKQNQRTT